MSSTNFQGKINELETKIHELESRIEELEKVVSAKQTVRSTERPEKEKRTSPISVQLSRKSYHKANYDIGDAGDRIDFTFRFTNQLAKDIRAFTGQVVFKDLFDREIMKIGLTNETVIRSRSSYEWKGGIEYNQFLPEHQRLLSIDQKDLQIELELDKIIYVDGTRQSFVG